MNEGDLSPEALSLAFFDRPAESVVLELAETIYLPNTPPKNFLKGQGRTILLNNDGNDLAYRILLAQSYTEDIANKIWKGSRADEIRQMQAGDTITYQSRAGVLTFIKTQGADNILLRGLTNESTGDAFLSATQVTKALGLNVGDRGNIQVNPNGLLHFKRYSIN